MKNLKLTLALAALVAFAGSASALPMITGGISLAGGYTVNTGDLNTATSFTSFSNVIVTSASGSYAFIAPATAATMNTFQFSPFLAPVTPLWTTINGSAFDLNSLSSIMQTGNDALELRGSGMLKLNGFDPTPGSWIFTANQAGGTFSFSSSNAAYVPDGGTTAMLLGSALAGLAFLRRKLA